MTLVHVSGPDELPVSLDIAKMHIVAIDDDQMEAYIRSALAQIEVLCGAFMPQAWRWIGRFPAGDAIVLDIGPLISVEELAYVDAAGAAQVLDPAEYSLDTWSPVGRVIRTGSAWPATSAAGNAVTVDFTVGRASVPVPVRHAIMVTAADAYMNREGGGALPAAAASLISPYRRIAF